MAFTVSFLAFCVLGEDSSIEGVSASGVLVLEVMVTRPLVCRVFAVRTGDSIYLDLPILILDLIFWLLLGE